MAREPRPLGSYLWNTATDIGAAAYAEGSKAAADIGNTYQALLYGGWSPQAAHNASARSGSQQILEGTTIAENVTLLGRSVSEKQSGTSCRAQNICTFLAFCCDTDSVHS